MKLLIADDELFIIKGLLSLDWKSINVTVCGAAQDGNETLDLARHTKPDIILSDISMPAIDGTSLVREILSENSDCRIIFLSGYSDFQYAKAALSIGVFDYILKLSSPDEIFNCVQRATSRILKERNEKISLHVMQEELRAHQIVDKLIRNKDNDSSEPCTQTSDNFVNRIIEYIESNYMYDISLMTLSQEMHLNSIYISRLLKKNIGYTFLEILTAARMIKAAKLLRNTDINISQVSEAVGINDQRYFSQVFKKIFNQTPRHFRNLNNVDIKKDIFDILKKWMAC